MAVILGFILMIALGVPVGFSMVLAAFIYVLSTGAVSLTLFPVHDQRCFVLHHAGHSVLHAGGRTDEQQRHYKAHFPLRQ